MKIRRAKEQSIKVKTDSIKLAGVQGAKSATRQIEGGQEVLDAAMTAYVISKPERAVAKHGTKLVKRKSKRIKISEANVRKSKRDWKLMGETDIVPTNYYDILAVYMVKYGMGEAATIINDTTKGWIETVVDDMCDYTLSDGTEVTVNEDGTEVSQTVLYINVKLKSYEDMISVYGLNEEKVKIAGQIKNDLTSK